MDFEPRMPDEVWGLWIRVANGWAPALQATGGRVWFRSRRLAEVYADKLQALYQLDAQPVRLDKPPRPGLLGRMWEWRKRRNVETSGAPGWWGRVKARMKAEG